MLTDDAQTELRRRTFRGGAGPVIARTLLATLIAAIGFSPRLRISDGVDLRIQDFALIPAVAFCLLNPMIRMRRVWGPAAGAFLFGSILTMTVHLHFDWSFLQLGAYGRALQIFLLAGVIGNLYVASGDGARVWASKTIYCVIYANVAWFTWQWANGSSDTLLGDSLGAVAYGPRLIGEPSAFGAGFFFAFASAFSIAQFRSRMGPRALAAVTYLFSLVGVYLSASRISFAAVLAVGVAAFISVGQRGTVLARLVAIGIGICAIAVLAGASLETSTSTSENEISARLSSNRVGEGFDTRVNRIWMPMATVVADNALAGLGPGGPDRQVHGWPEAHNGVLRAWLDYGVPVGTAFLLVFIVAYRRASFASQKSTNTDLALFANLAMLVLLALAVTMTVHDSLVTVTAGHWTAVALGLFGGASAMASRPHGSESTGVRRPLSSAISGGRPR